LSVTEINRSGECGNSPKNQLVENVSVALATADVDALSEWVTDEARWEVVGGPTARGRSDLAAAVERAGREEPTAVIIEHVVTHGKAGAVSGRVAFGQRTREFCDVYEFSTARGTHVQSVKSYRIDTD
jgi:hypothetical protein